jgi:ketosteroid isomerase-like protein
MKRRVTVFVTCTLICFFYAAQARESGTAEAERYIKKSEHQWAEAVASGDVAVVERILAEDFVGVDTDGSFYKKAKAVADTRETPKEFISNHANEVKVRFYGDAAVAQGSESWIRRTEQPLRGRFVWTDTWVRRNGKWQIVAAEDLIAPELAK